MRLGEMWAQAHISLCSLCLFFFHDHLTKVQYDWYTNMLETNVLMGGARKRVILDSGPGPVSYDGDEYVGFFGEVAQSELFSSDELVARYPSMVASGNAGYKNAPYLKFWYYGKVLFIKKFPGITVSWAQLFADGLIYGPEGKQNTLYAPEKDQTTVLSKNGYRYYLRTITGDEQDITTITPISLGNYQGDDKVRRRSMYTELLYRMVTGAVAAYPEKKFDSLVPTTVIPDSGYGGETCREISERQQVPGTASMMTRTSTTLSGGVPYFTAVRTAYFPVANTSLWRPVLEFIPNAAPIQIYGSKVNMPPDSFKLELTANSPTADSGSGLLTVLKNLVNKTNGLSSVSVSSIQSDAPIMLKNLILKHTNMNSPSSITGTWTA